MKDNLRQEFFTYGNQRSTLIYGFNEKKAIFQSVKGKKRFKSKQKSLKKDKNRAVLIKSFEIEDVKASAQLLFQKGANADFW